MSLRLNISRPFIYDQQTKRVFSVQDDRFYDLVSITSVHPNYNKEMYVVDRVVCWPDYKFGCHYVALEGENLVVFNNFRKVKVPDQLKISPDTLKFIELLSNRIDNSYAGNERSKVFWTWLATIAQNQKWKRVKGLCLEYVNHELQYLIIKTLRVVFGLANSRVVPSYETSPLNNYWADGNQLVIFDNLEVNHENRDYIRSLISKRIININDPKGNYVARNITNFLAFTKSNKEFSLDSRYWITLKDRGFTIFGDDYKVADEEIIWLLAALRDRRESFQAELLKFLLDYDISNSTDEEIMLGKYLQY